jgi:hypothetical protein
MVTAREGRRLLLHVERFTDGVYQRITSDADCLIARG